MKFKFTGASLAVLASALTALTAQAETATATNSPDTITINGKRVDNSIENPPSTVATVTEEAIAKTVNAVSVEDTLKYLPSLVVRKRNIGDNFAPIATRTSGLGSSARSLIYADGALLSALIGNNNGNGSPRWTLVTPEEIERIDVLYGPFSAAYSGNSIGTTVNIKTRMPTKLEARATILTNHEDFSLYGTNQSLGANQFSASAGDKFGTLAILASFTRTDAHSQPISFTTTTGTTNPTGATGGYADVNKSGQAIRVLGAGGIEHHIQDTGKLKMGWDLTPNIHGRYILGVWTDNTGGAVQSYLTNASGATTYLTASSGVTTGFNSAVYSRNALHYSHVLDLQGDGPTFDWQVIGTLYDYSHDWQNNPSPDTASGTTAATGFVGVRNDLPGAFAGGVGTIQKQDGTGWRTLDAKADLRLGPDAQHTVSGGLHLDQETLNARTFTIANWRDSGSALGQLRSASHGATQTWAVWAQDQIKLTPALSLTVGGRYEGWTASQGYNTTLSTTVNSTIVQPNRNAHYFSPKASLEWRIQDGLSLRLSAGQAYRTPTVGELYQTTSVGTLLTNPNPGLQAEQAASYELALEKSSDIADLRISIFSESIRNALISQLNIATNTTYIQNVDQTRAEGVELAASRQNLLPKIDVSGSLTYVNAITAKDTANPAAVGKLLPSVPHWKGSMTVSWRPTDFLTLSTAARFTSRNFANLANDDTVGNTYQGFYQYLVVDARAVWKVNDHFDLSVGVDNLNNDKYFLFHPFPQRSFFAQVNWKM
ncbi:MAG TPA: TonB-dependent receptor [Caulobacteraceae bacterium]|nr:TonB-dependent receptor [Caulobacteraceae bacterium]